MEGKRLQSRGRNFAGAATVRSTGPTLEGILAVATEVKSHE